MKRALVSGVLSSCGIAEMTEAAAPCRPQRLSAGRRATRARAILRSTAGTRFPPLPAVRSRPTGQVDFRSWCISGGERMRFPVVAKIALSTAGAATAIVGSPTPPGASLPS